MQEREVGGGGGGGGGGGFAGVIKYFRHIFLKIFYGPQNNFLCSLPILTLSKFIWKLKWVWAENIQTGDQEDLSKIRQVKQQINSFGLLHNKW